MKIQNPVLVVDISDWCDHLNIKELEDAGVVSVIVGVYDEMVNGKRRLTRKSREHLTQVAKSSLVLQTYFWDDIIQDPIEQANWLVDMLVMEGFPVKWTWADQEQWWLNWQAWYAALKSKDYSKVPIGAPTKVSWHYQMFMTTLFARRPQSGVYTNKGFVSSWAPSMDLWLSKYRVWVPQYAHQPSAITKMSWTTLKLNWYPAYNISLSYGQLPINVVGHQFTGDRCILPGCYDFYGRAQTTDVSLFTKEFITALKNDQVPVPPVTPPAPVVPNIFVVNILAANVRKIPTAVGNNPIGVISKNTQVTVNLTEGQYSHFLPQLGFLNGGWIFSQYLTRL